MITILAVYAVFITLCLVALVCRAVFSPPNFLAGDIRVLMHLPSGRWTYGLDLRRNLQESSMRINETGVAASEVSLGAIYRCLHRLEQAHLVKGRWSVEPLFGARRREYRPLVKVQTIV